jgi:kynurenine formamidase
MTTTTWIEISVPIHPGMVHWPDNPPVRVDYMLHMDRGDVWYRLDALTILRKVGGEQ